MKFDGKRLTEIWETKINYSKLKKPQTEERLWIKFQNCIWEDDVMENSEEQITLKKFKMRKR